MAPSTLIPRTPQLQFRSIGCGALPVSARVSRLRGRSGIDEYHMTLCPTQYADIETQLDAMARAYDRALELLGLDPQTAVLRRFFCTDLSNQAAALERRAFANPRNDVQPCAVSWVEQPPMPPARAALWAYHVNDPGAELDKSRKAASLTLRRGDLSHHWTTMLTHTAADTAYAQTRGVLEKYEAVLQDRHLCLADHVLRTWFFVRDIDTDYSGLVAARGEFFAQHGLTPDTHFIASTGIEGASADPTAKIAMDAYAVSGVRPGQIEYLKAPDHLGPTHTYGVTFERGTSVAYRDRKHVIISGTASIGPEGRVLYPKDFSRQLDRTVENIEALLAQAGAGLEDLCIIIAYVRDPNDRTSAWRQLLGYFGDAPLEVVAAPVCRPGWLIEIEGQAIVPDHNPGLPPF